MRWRRRVRRRGVRGRMTAVQPQLGLGIGWRPALASLVLRREDLGFVEILAEAYPATQALPLALVEAGRRGLAIIPHGVGLSLGGAERPHSQRIAFLASLADRVNAPLVSEHVAFVRAGGVEAGHLLPVPRTRASLEVLIENVSAVVEQLTVPLALEPIASLFDWPDPELSEAEFLCELVDRTEVFLLLDVANIYANAQNRGFDPTILLDALPLERVAYVHVAGGMKYGGLYHDTHAHAVPEGVLDLLDRVSRRQHLPGVMLERDEAFPPTPAIAAELDAIKAAGRLAEPMQPRRRRCFQRHAPASRSLHAAASAREDLARDQAALVRALVTAGPHPSGFDPAHLAAAAAVLLAKRAHRAPQVG